MLKIKTGDATLEIYGVYKAEQFSVDVAGQELVIEHRYDVSPDEDPDRKRFFYSSQVIRSDKGFHSAELVDLRAPGSRPH